MVLGCENERTNTIVRSSACAYVPVCARMHACACVLVSVLVSVRVRVREGVCVHASGVSEIHIADLCTAVTLA